jgi:hypothetical protein
VGVSPRMINQLTPPARRGSWAANLHSWLGLPQNGRVEQINRPFLEDLTMIRCPLIARCLAVAVVAGLLATTITSAADKKKGKKLAAITLAEVDADFAVQGEYSGTIVEDGKNVRLGIQVIALGDGKFRAVAHPGGLPGDGWGGVTKIEADGAKGDDGVVRFKSDKGQGWIKKGSFTVANVDGKEFGSLKRVIRKSPTLGAKPPKGAVVLFDGSSVEGWEGGKKTDDGLLMQGTRSKHKIQSGRVHIEFLTSYMPYAREQDRSNSGIYLQGRYEVQMLDSFGLAGKNNESGGIYEISDPSTNMCFPPLSWQTYDIDYTAAKFDEAGKKTANGRITVRHNGVVVQKDVELPRITRAAPIKESADAGPIYLQNHGNPLRYRNIWFLQAK